MAKSTLSILMRASLKRADVPEVQLFDLSEWFDTVLSEMRRLDVAGFSAVLWQAMETAVTCALTNQRPFTVEECTHLYQRRLTGSLQDVTRLAQVTVTFFDRHLRDLLTPMAGRSICDFNTSKQQLCLYPETLTYDKQRELPPPSLSGFEQYLKACEHEGHPVPREVWRLLRDYAAQTQDAERLACVS